MGFSSRIYFGCDDIHEYFNRLKIDDKLPTFSELKEIAQTLNRRYGSLQGYYAALRSNAFSEDPIMQVPDGSPWKPQSAESALASAPSKNPADMYRGDQCLAHSMMFIHDTIISREMTMAVAEGDSGRVYEMMKVS